MAAKTKQGGLRCPFTGQPIEVVILGGAVGHDIAYMGRVSSPLGSYSTSAFPTKEALVYFLSHRNGKPAPGVPAEPPSVTVRERTPPAPDAFEDIKSRQGELNDAAQDFFSRVSAVR